MSDDEISAWELKNLEPEEIQEKYGAGEDHPLVQETGQYHIEREIDPVLENTILLFFSERLSDYLQELAMKLREGVNDSEDIRWEIPFGSLGIDLYQMHTMSISYFEAGAYLFVSDYLVQHPHSDGSKRLVDAIYERKEHVLKESQSYEERLQSAHQRIQTDDHLRAGFYKFVLDEAGFLNEQEVEALKGVNDVRGDFVHDSFGLVGITEKEPVLTMVNNCDLLVNTISDLLHDYVEYDSNFYETFRRKDMFGLV